MSDKKIIKGSVIITQDQKYGIMQKGDILIENGKIAAVAEEIEAGDAQVIDGSGKIALPGFVDAHRHNWESLLRSSGVDWTLEQYFTAVKKILGPAYTADDVYFASYIGALECLDCGITTLFDWFHNNNGPEYADAAIAGLKDAGIRAVLGYSNSIYGELPVSSVPMDYEDFRRVKKQYFSSDEGLMTIALASRGPQFLDFGMVEEELKLAEETDTFVVMHVGDGSWGKTHPISRLSREGLLKSNMTFIHCNTLADSEIEQIGELGADTVSCPEVELNMGHGFLPTLRLLKAGVQPALGIDVCTSIPGDMFGVMRSMLAGVRSVVNNEGLLKNESIDPLPLLATDVLKFATQNGANACKLGKKTGSITPGKEADITLIEMDSLNMIPMNGPVNAVVEAANPGNVDTVIVAGKIVKQNKKLAGVDLAELKKKADDRARSLYQRAGIAEPEKWIPPVYKEGD